MGYQCPRHHRAPQLREKLSGQLLKMMPGGGRHARRGWMESRGTQEAGRQLICVHTNCPALRHQASLRHPPSPTPPLPAVKPQQGKGGDMLCPGRPWLPPPCEGHQLRRVRPRRTAHRTPPQGCGPAGHPRIPPVANGCLRPSSAWRPCACAPAPPCPAALPCHTWPRPRPLGWRALRAPGGSAATLLQGTQTPCPRPPGADPWQPCGGSSHRCPPRGVIPVKTLPMQGHPARNAFTPVPHVAAENIVQAPLAARADVPAQRTHAAPAAATAAAAHNPPANLPPRGHSPRTPRWLGRENRKTPAPFAWSIYWGNTPNRAYYGMLNDHDTVTWRIPPELREGMTEPHEPCPPHLAPLVSHLPTRGPGHRCGRCNNPRPFLPHNPRQAPQQPTPTSCSPPSNSKLPPAPKVFLSMSKLPKQAYR